MADLHCCAVNVNMLQSCSTQYETTKTTRPEKGSTGWNRATYSTTSLLFSRIRIVHCMSVVISYSLPRLWFYLGFTDLSQVHPVWGMLNIAMFMCVACCHCKQAAICIECHCCDAGRIFEDLIQSLLVFSIPNVHHTITACVPVSHPESN